MPSLEHLFAQNRQWVESLEQESPGFFRQLAGVQSPDFLWIGCSDSRVPANEIVGLLPGELFVHRNVGNVVVHTDLNCLSVIQFAVAVLGVRHIMVVGHHRCGAVRAALDQGRPLTLLDNWLRHVEDVAVEHVDLLADLPANNHVDALCELNVIHQVHNVARTTVARETWAQGRPLHIHGWVYGLTDGVLHDLGVTHSADQDQTELLAAAAARVRDRYR